LINMPAHLGETMALYQGRLVRAEPITPGGDDVALAGGTTVNKADLEALFSERMLFGWKGEQFLLTKYQDGVVSGMLYNGNNTFAREHKLTGDPYMGWGGEFPEHEIDGVWIEKFDLLGSWQYRKEMGQPPPHGLYLFLRSATEHEWVRETPSA
jgi:hypothetical protein